MSETAASFIQEYVSRTIESDLDSQGIPEEDREQARKDWTSEVLSDLRGSGEEAPGFYPFRSDLSDRYFQMATHVLELEGRHIAYPYWYGGGKHTYPELQDWAPHAVFVAKHVEMRPVTVYKVLDASGEAEVQSTPMDIKISTASLSEALASLKPFEEQASKTLHGRVEPSHRGVRAQAEGAFYEVDKLDLNVGTVFVSDETKAKLIEAKVLADDGTLWGASVVVDAEAGSDLVTVPEDCEGYDPNAEVPTYEIS